MAVRVPDRDSRAMNENGSGAPAWTRPLRKELMLRLPAELMHEQPALVERLRVDEVLARLDHHHATLAGSSGAAYPGARDAMQRLGAAFSRRGGGPLVDSAHIRLP